MYYYSRNIDFTKEDLEVDQDYAKDSKYIVKAVFDGAKKLASSQAMWTTDEVARLHEARGDRNKKPVQGGWASIAEYVGTGKSIGQCQYKWDRLCHVDDLKALGDNQNNSTAANGATNTKENYRAWWTPDEIMQLKALFDTPFDRKNPRLRIAYALFPQMPQAQVRYTMENLRSAWDTRRRRTHASESQPLLQKLVSDSGGAEKADWEAISKEIGFDSLSVPKDLPQDNCGKV
ncbi:hypothetical protein LPJ59_002761 [Coemansia sp. RSA 2399]|nr:hypothetical protein LPJ59_002761 [Coemansia sp. RSA 2399]KAJ1903978.1 hypothetical protein LPJ81_002763 [Coemansia sp. IMI 209127]